MDSLHLLIVKENSLYINFLINNLHKCKLFLSDKIKSVHWLLILLELGFVLVSKPMVKLLFGNGNLKATLSIKKDSFIKLKQ